MQYGLNVVTLGDYADPRLVVRLAQAAELAGWHGLFVWDHLAFAWGVPSGDPWVILAAVALATQHLKVGTAVTPLPRRRPHILANTIATLDLLSQGRVILGVGLGGVPEEFTAFGEAGDARERAGRLDEGLEILNRLWSGEKVTLRGQHYTIQDVALAPLPVQRPRVPVWVGGDSRPALRRAAHWDGWVGGGDDEHGQMIKSPEQIAAIVATIRQHRVSSQPFDVALTGASQPGDNALVSDYAAAGVTWWLESLHGYRGSFEELEARVLAGPTKVVGDKD
ncbi:MAG: LLM class flavin-dependent oxidoreductase [Chloroflexi bacterium]|nr:LLM class flavin-dependent oxidoreductase [Chloroflexota bacterium]MCI0575597.1 LLM class flavin-dependent oxidoreductase [Chloroflexota bacterium]MCI0645066.1 LLM class flavin-dependent oxidoreductase [Chloroflexota bacterium]MCI0731902.1 LLM class flavin-dependent oxidoreductase [Chloroflexota bacterium]